MPRKPSDRGLVVNSQIAQNLIAGFNCQASTPVGQNPMNYDYWITLGQGQITSIQEAMDVVGDPAPDGPCWMPGG